MATFPAAYLLASVFCVSLFSSTTGFEEIPRRGNASYCFEGVIVANEVPPTNNDTLYALGESRNITCPKMLHRFGPECAICGTGGEWLVNTTCNDTTPLHRKLGYAAEAGDIDTVREILKLDYIDVNWKDDRGYWVLCWIYVGEPTALHRATQCCMGNVTAVVKELLDHGADIEAKAGWEAYTPLGLAAGNGKSIETLQILLDRGANIEGRDDKGYTALHWAAEERHTDVVRFLLDRGADIEAKGNDEFTPLIYSATKRINAETVSYLLDRGANINAKDHQGQTALMRTSGITPSLDTVRVLLQRGAEVDTRDKDGVTPLTNAAESGIVSNARLLIQYGADVNARTNDQSTPLIRVARFGWLETSRLLLDHCADVNARDATGRSALMVAATKNWTEPLIRLLVSRGASAEGCDPAKWPLCKIAL